MKILINGLILSNHNSGLGVYTYKVLENIYKYFDLSQFSYEILCQDAAFLPSNVKSHAIVHPCKNFVERNLCWEHYACKKGVDLIWSTTQHGSIFSKAKQIITIHDLMPVFYPKGRYHQYLFYKMVLPRLIKKSSAVITVSNNSKADIIDTYHLKSKDKIKVVYNGIDIQPSFETNNSILRKINEKTFNYYVIIGIHYPYKNIHSVIDAYYKYPKLQEHKVYIIGNDKVKYAGMLKNKIQKLNLKNSFVFTGFLSESEKNTLIQNSIASIYPSLYEGFGLPVLESLALGTPVICSNTSSLPEVGGEAALYFDPMNIDDIASKIEQITTDKVLRDNLLSHRDEQINKFSWKKTANNIFSIIREI